MFEDQDLPKSVLAFGVPVAVPHNVAEALENRETFGVACVPVVAVRARSVA